MITRFYVDNYKCLQNFEYKPKQFELVVGANGSGKSTVFEALDKVRQFTSSKIDVIDVFPTETNTRWRSRSFQAFEVDFIVGESTIRYRLDVSAFKPISTVTRESLMRDDQLYFESSWETKPANNDFSEEEDVRIVKHKSGNSTLLSEPNHSILASYGKSVHDQALSNFFFLMLNPSLMTAQVKRPEPRPANDLSNFASYYIYALQQQQGKMFEMMPHLKEVIPDFDSFAVEENFEEARRDLFVVCRSKEKGKSSEIRYRFDELSDGQRALIALYTLLFCTLDENTTLVIDEPENYVALRELQPWLSLLQERLEEHGGQVILISHHPEFINALAPQTTVFERDSGGPVRVKAFDSELAKTLAPAEIMARGWES